MKSVSFLRLLTAVGSALSAVALLDLTGVAKVLDPGLSNYLLAAGPVALALKELVVGIGDILDDGKPNKSFKVGLLLIVLALVLIPLLPPCAELQGVSGRIVTKEGEFVVLPNGRVEIVVDAMSGK